MTSPWQAETTELKATGGSNFARSPPSFEVDDKSRTCCAESQFLRSNVTTVKYQSILFVLMSIFWSLFGVFGSKDFVLLSKNGDFDNTQAPLDWIGKKETPFCPDLGTML